LSSHPLLTAPIGRSLLRLAGPTTGLMVVQIFVALFDVYLLGRLGTDALAGLALVFPFMALLLNIANGGMGGSVAAAMARALGAGRREDARDLVLHALVLGLGFAAVFTAFAWMLAPALYRFMGGSGRAFENALTFTRIWFSAAAVFWVSCLLAALLRGAGAAATAGRYGLLASASYMPLAALLALGIGDRPGLGVAGPAIASVVVTAGAAWLQARVLWRDFKPRIRGIRPRWRLFRVILGVGLIGSSTTVIGSLTAMLVTALVGRFGVVALAGYGIGARLEHMLGPLAFGIGTGATTLVGVAAGAGDWRRAVRVAWTGGLVAFFAIGALGWAVALLPEDWSRLFAAEPEVIAASVAYIVRVAPFFCLLGLGLTLHFAAQGAGRMMAPLAAGLLRMAVTVAGGWFAAEQMGLGLEGVCAAIGLGFAVYGVAIAGSLLVAPWRARTRRASTQLAE
jgi:putative MATE family efflux protein